MAFYKVDISTLPRRIALVAAALAFCGLMWCAGRWDLGNSASLGLDRRDMVDIVTSLAPGDPQAHYAAAVVLKRTFEPEDLARSLAEYHRAADLAPNNYLVWTEYAKALDNSGDRDAARKAYERTLLLAPAYADVNWAYGNFLLRRGDNDDEAFTLLRNAARSRPSLAAASIPIALAVSDGDVDRASRWLGSTDSVNAAFVSYFAAVGDLDRAGAFWGRLTAEARAGEQSKVGAALADKAITAKRFRLAASVLSDIGTEPASHTGAVTNGGFESGIKLESPTPLDWHVDPGTEPEIALVDRGHSGAVSLRVSFNSNRATDLRRLRQTVAVAPGERYRLSVFYKSELRAAEDKTAHFEIFDLDNGASLGRTPAFALNAEWTSVTADISVPPDQTGVEIRLVRDACYSAMCTISGRLWLDDISIEKL